MSVKIVRKSKKLRLLSTFENDKYCFVCHKHVSQGKNRSQRQHMSCQNCFISVHKKHFVKNPWDGDRCQECTIRDNSLMNGSRLKISQKKLSEALGFVLELMTVGENETSKYVEVLEEIDLIIEGCDKVLELLTWSMIKRKIEGQEYSFVEEFEYDFRLVSFLF